MDVAFPYADGLSRRQVLYRLPTVPEPRRLLLVSSDAGSGLIGASWGGPVTVMPPSGLDAGFLQEGPRFDAVALPWLTGAQGSPSGRGSHMLQLAHSLLVPGGMVIGHLHNAHTLRRLTTVRGLAEALAKFADRRSMGSVAGCHAALLRAGYAKPECWYVQPSIDSPMGLIPTDPVAARAHFLRWIRAGQSYYSRPAYAARLLVAVLGLGGMQQNELFFWATKPC